MPRLLYGRDAEIAAWVDARIEISTGNGFGPCAGIGVVSDGGTLWAGVVFHDYQPAFRTIQVTMASASPMWARRDVIRGLLSYPFVQLNAFKVWAAVMLGNDHGIETFRHIGFKREAVLAHQFGRGRHCVMMRLLKTDFDRLYGA